LLLLLLLCVRVCCDTWRSMQVKSSNPEFKGQVAKCKQIIADPSYFIGTDKVKKTGQVARWMFIKNDPIPETEGAKSIQIILPQKQTGRKSDIYVSMVSSDHQIAPQGKYVAMIQANVETANPKKELEVAKKLVGNFVKEYDPSCGSITLL
jgi:Rab GDP dissociation inhibitor